MKKTGCPHGTYRNGGKCIDNKCKGLERHSFIGFEGMHSHTRGYILPDGSFVDADESEFEDFCHELIANKFSFYDIDDLMDNCKCIRTTGGHKELDIESIHKPTDKQIKKLVDIILDNNIENILADRSDTPCKFGQPGGHSNKPVDLQRWVSRCWP